MAGLRNALREPGHYRQGRLAIWGQVVRSHPGRGIGLLRSLVSDAAEGDGDIWSETLYGLDKTISRPSVVRRATDVLARAPHHLFQDSEFTFSASKFLVSAAEQNLLPPHDIIFWQLWDLIFEASLADDKEGALLNKDPLLQSMEQPVGKLTTALLNLMSKNNLKALSSYPLTVQDRLERLIQPQLDKLRPARVVLALHLNYLFYVDPDWINEHLIPFFDWSHSEEEAFAVWQGYAWGNNCINADIWSVLSEQFFEALHPERLERLGPCASKLVKLLMVVSVELPETEVSSERTRDAIRIMTPENRKAAASWLHQYLRGPYLEKPPSDFVKEKAISADKLWTERVAPWIKRVWPRNANLVTTGTSESFALLAITTDQQFNHAVNMLLPYIGPTQHWGYPVADLAKSAHPDKQPETTLKLIDKLVDPQKPQFARYLRDVSNRIIESKHELQKQLAFKRLNRWTVDQR